MKKETTLMTALILGACLSFGCTNEFSKSSGNGGTGLTRTSAGGGGGC